MSYDILLQAEVTIRFRTGGERLKIWGKDQSISLKKWLQSHAVPPWQRDRVPLLYVNGELRAVLID